MSRPRLVVLGSPGFASLELLREAGIPYVASEDVDALREEAADADVLLVAPRAGNLLRDVFPFAKRARWVHTLAAGVESLLFEGLRASDVPLTNGRGLFADALGEFAIAAMLWFAKDLARLRRNQEAHRWEPFLVEHLQGTNAGIIGYGSIGRAVGSRCTALGMQVVPYRRTEGSLEETLRAADYLVVATPLTPETRGLLGAPELALLKPSAVLINVGRGPVVDEAALIGALRNGTLRGAALDVFETEPLPPEHPLWTFENVLLSPHCADHTADSHPRSMHFFLENLARFERGQALGNVVDKRAGY